ncbi:MAG: RusA family crossover junction endodeoxyribonuclease [Agriterribacter sp.]
MKVTIIGQVPSKSNLYRIGKQGFYKPKILTDYENAFFLQCNHYRNKMISGFFELYLDVYYPSNRSDLDNALKIVLDVLQKKVKAIENDNKMVKLVANKFVSKENPRVEFEIIEL